MDRDRAQPLPLLHRERFGRVLEVRRDGAVPKIEPFSIRRGHAQPCVELGEYCQFR